MMWEGSNRWGALGRVLLGAGLVLALACGDDDGPGAEDAGGVVMALTHQQSRMRTLMYTIQGLFLVKLV